MQQQRACLGGNAAVSRIALLLLMAACTASAVKHKEGDSTDEPHRWGRGLNTFGKGMLKEFSMAKGYTNLNHGSYGTTPLHVQKMQNEMRERMEAIPDRWFRKHMYIEMDRTRKSVAQYIKAEADDVALVDNASHGVNAVLRSLLRGGGKVLVMNTAYQMVKNTLAYLHDTFEESVVEVEITLPITAEGILATTAEVLDANPDLSLAVIDHITSCPAIVMPLDRLIPMLKARGLLVLVDGAHAIGQISLDVPSLGADFYVSNGHKWLYSPKSSAILWAKKEVQALLHPTVISGLGKGTTPFQLDFSYQGTSDVTALIAMWDALSWRQLRGEEEIMGYIRWLAGEGGKLLVDMWGTATLVGEDMACAMVNVKLPYCANETLVKNLPETLMTNYHTWVPSFKLSDGWYVRVSAQIYNDLDDFKLLGSAVLDIFKACSPKEL